MTQDSTPLSTDWSERRVHHKVREVFTQACALLAPHILNTEAPVSALTLARMVRNHFSDLSDAEIHVLITAVVRMREEQRLQAILESKPGKR
ncbi:MAG: hypothetical protein HZB71_12610 [Betaproteobacteria bacterium]|nr:hypothetical protein [Betaproteobacteria bacterium]